MHYLNISFFFSIYNIYDNRCKDERSIWIFYREQDNAKDTLDRNLAQYDETRVKLAR